VVRDLHLRHDGRPIIRYCDIAIGGYEDLVQPARTEGGFHDRGDSSGGDDVGFDGFDAVGTFLLALISDDDEGSAILALRYLSCG
jgi:hypothetical protein